MAARRHRSAVKSEQPFCEICGGLLRRNSTTGVCTRNPECKNEHRRRMYAATKMTEQPVCEICGGPVRSDNSVGVCKGNPDCKAEAQRRRYAASNASRRANARQWRREHREQHLANKARYRKNNPESVKESARKIREKNGVTPRGETQDPYTPTWIYALYNDRDQVLYIGQTVRELSLRLWQHRQEEDAWRAEIAYIRPVDRVPFKDADGVEQAMIRVFRDRGYELRNKYLTRSRQTAESGVGRRDAPGVLRCLVLAVQHVPLSMPGDEALQVLRGTPASDGLL